MLEEESKTAAQKPRVMKKFSETKKAEKVVANIKSGSKQPLPSIEIEEEEDKEVAVEQSVENGGANIDASARDKTLNKLGVRGRGGGRLKKTTSTTTSKKLKE